MLILGVRLDGNRSKSVRSVWDMILVVLETINYQGHLHKKFIRHIYLFLIIFIYAMLLLIQPQLQIQ